MRPYGGVLSFVLCSGYASTPVQGVLIVASPFDFYIEYSKKRKYLIMTFCKCISVAVIIVICSIPSAFCAPEKFTDLNIAIIDFEGVGITATEASVVTDKFRYAILENSTFKIMERALMEEILKEQGFQQTGACNTASCMVETGQLLGVRYLIAGKVSRAGDMYAFAARLIDVKTGEIVLAITNESTNKFPPFISTDIPAYSYSFIQKLKTYFEEAAKTNQTGMLYIETSPLSGEVILDQEPTGKNTPVTFSNLKPGKHSVRVLTNELVGSEEVTIKAGQLSKISMSLLKGKSAFLITTTPVNADVFIDGKFIGKAPISNDSLEAGFHTVSVQLQGYETISQKMAFNVAHRMEKSFALSPLAFLKISGVKIPLSVQIDEKKFEISTDGVFKTAPGMHKILITAKGYNERLCRLAVLHGDTLKLTPDLIPKKAMLRIETQPENATVKIDGKDGFSQSSTTPTGDILLEPGQYFLEYSSRKYEPNYKTITLAPAETLQIRETLYNFTADYIAWKNKKDACKTYNLFLTGLGDVNIKPTFEGCLLLSAGILSDVFIGISVYQFASHYQQAQNATMANQRSYYQSRQTEDQYWLIGSVITSALLRYISYEISNNRLF